MNTPSTAVQVIIAVIPIVGIVFGSAVIFFYLFWSYRMKMLLIEKGSYQRLIERFDLETFSLLTGLVLTGVGGSMVLFFYLKEGISYSLLGGLVPLAVGLSLVAYYIIKMATDKRAQ